MANIVGIPNIDLRVTLSLNEEEARALEALAGYGEDAFIKAFYEKLGQAYMAKHEAGLRSLLESVRKFIPGILKRMDAARRTFADGKRFVPEVSDRRTDLEYEVRE